MSDIRPNQRKAIEALATGHTVAQTAVIADVTERTIYNWKIEPAFKAEMQHMTDSKLQDASLFLSNSLMLAFKTMNQLCEFAESESTRLAAAKCIADSMLKIQEHYDIVNRIAELEERLNEIGTHKT